jgi:hypothetical protein
MNMGKFKSIHVGDLIITAGRSWKVVGCYYGALGHENIIGLKSLDKKPGTVGEQDCEELLVPIDLIPPDSIFRAVDHPMWEAGPPISRDTSPAALAV